MPRKVGNFLDCPVLRCTIDRLLLLEGLQDPRLPAACSSRMDTGAKVDNDKAPEDVLTAAVRSRMICLCSSG